MKKWIIVIVIIAVLLLGGGLFGGYMITNSDTILPNVCMGDIQLGKLNLEQAKAALLEQGWEDRVENTLTVSTIGDVSVELEPVEAGFVLSLDSAAQAAFDYGHDGNIVENLFTYIKSLFSSVDINSLHSSANAGYIDGKMAELSALMDEYMGEEEYIVDTENEEMLIKKGWNQIELDSQLLHEEIELALSRGESELSFTQLSSQPESPDFQAIHTELEREPVNASYAEDGSFEVIDEVVGCRFDVSQAQQLWDEAQPGDEVRIPLDITWPDVTGEQLRDRLYHDLLGAVTTKYPNSGEARRSNLRLATSMIDGIILYPGETFSFNETVGVRTEEAGFQPAPAYVDGDVKDELGGGVCQVSSTLYAATAMAFLETVERECHYFPVNYMQLGTDATVTIPAEGRAIDFKFKNNKSYPIKIVGYCNNDESSISFEIWGTLEDDDYMPLTFDNSYGYQFDYILDIEPAYPDRAGYTIKLTHETYSFEDDVGPGYRTVTHRQVIDAEGNMVLDELINTKLANGNHSMDTYYLH